MHPRLIQIGPFPLYSFGLLVVLGFLAGIFLAVRLARRRGAPGEVLLDGAVVMLLSAILGARLLFVALNWREFAAHPWEILNTWQGGMSFHGGLAGGILSGVLYVRARRAAALPLADAAAPGFALGYAIGRIGCFLNGCCYGEPTSLPWGIPGIYCQGAPDPSLHYHPTQIYALVLNLALAALLTRAYLRPHRPGQVLALYIGGYSVYRFAIEALRKGVTAEVFAFGLTQAQVFSLFAIAAAAAWWLWLQRHAPPAPELVPQQPPAVSASPTPAES